jgi:CheY-like chemotaxis protein
MTLANTIPFPTARPDVPTILVVDDEKGVRQLFTHWVTSLGYAAKGAGDSDEALELMRTGGINAVLCDIRMPGRDGVWLIDQLRTQYPATPIVIATGLSDMRPELTLSPGIAGYLVKPFQREQLAVVLEHALAPDSPWTGGGNNPRRPVGSSELW